MGDACGVPFEFHSSAQLHALPAGAIDFPPALPSGFDRAHAGAPARAWLDDGAMAMALLDSLRQQDGLELEDLGRRFLLWEQTGAYAVDAQVFDINETDNGNGSLMRVLPVALWHQGSDEDLCRMAQAQGLPTHGHLRSQVACALYCLWARQLLAGQQDGFDQAVNRLLDIYETQGNTEGLRELDVILAGEARAPRGLGYVVDTLWSARQAFLSSSSYDEVVRNAILLGNDCDTTAAVADGLAGLRGGMAGLPARWIAALPQHDFLDDCLNYLASDPPVAAARRAMR